jgi:4-hydroxy-3-polyprenylbenzoate decarboxylase
MRRFVLGITGATGPVIGLRLLRELARSSTVCVAVSAQSFSIIRHETGLDLRGGSEQDIRNRIREFAGSENVQYYDEHNFSAPIASGSFKTDGMFVAPCSMKSLSGIAYGYSNGLIERAADVTIKEGRPLVLSPREMPFSAIHLDNMLKLARLGVTIAPPVMAFYQKPRSIDDLVDFVVGRMLDLVGIEHELYRRWDGGDI